MSKNNMQHGTEELGFMTATELCARLAAKQVSSVELTQYFIDRIERYDNKLNAVVVKDFDRALSAAQDADKLAAQGRSMGPLHGLPMTIKESYNIAGLKTTWGLPMWKDMVARSDSDVVRAYKSAGAHFMGKTNVPLMLGDYQSFNDIYGQTNNPWDTDLVPGGSSGGSAAALAAGLTGLDSGSDIGGSIRNPAHYCGIYGHKPTWNIVPAGGHAPPVVQVSNGPDLAVVGPLARSAEDLQMAMDIIAGPMELQAPGWKLDLPKPRATQLKDLRVAFWHDDAAAPVDQEIVQRSRDVMTLLNRLGAKTTETARPDIDMAQAAFSYLNLMQAVNSSGVPEPMYKQNQTLADSFAHDDMSMAALFARASVQSHNDWVNNDRIRLMARHAWKTFFNDWDVLICPISATPAFPHNHGPMETRTVEVNGEPRPYFESSFWAGMITLPGLPSTVFPTAHSKDGLPIGLQAVCGEFYDYTCIEFARLIAQEMGGFVPPVGYNS